MLAIEVEFLTGRYVATAYNTRLDAEWPPHPARVFSALTATHFASERTDADERSVLEWLEAQDAPAIQASEASRREVVNVFVPVNDVALTNVDQEAAALDEALVKVRAAEVAGQPRAIKTALAAVAKAEKRLAAAIARAVSVPATTSNPRNAMKVLPEHRGRQPRTFPSVTPRDPRVTYLWPNASPTPAQRETLDRLLARVVRLGHSSSLVAARLVADVATPVWWPEDAGEVIFRTVEAGQLGALQRAYGLHGETEPRLTPARFRAYTSRTVVDELQEPCSAFSDDWVVLRRVGGPALPMVAAAGVARTVRKALMSHAGEVPEMLSGHTPDARPSQRDHLSIVPLPFVGHPHASGAILGVALVLPRDVEQSERRAVFAAVDAWERAERCEDEDTPRLPVHLGAAGVLELERVEWGVPQASLQAETWCRAARVWHSVSPMALDHNPGDLQSRNATRLATAVEEATASIRRACERIRLPDPVAIEILPAPAVAGAAKVRRYPPFPEGSERIRRVLTHVRIEFAVAVRGPILLGAGRYHGLGLFRPEPRYD